MSECDYWPWHDTSTTVPVPIYYKFPTRNYGRIEIRPSDITTYLQSSVHGQLSNRICLHEPTVDRCRPKIDPKLWVNVSLRNYRPSGWNHIDFNLLTAYKIEANILGRNKINNYKLNYSIVTRNEWRCDDFEFPFTMLLFGAIQFRKIKTTKPFPSLRLLLLMLRRARTIL